MKPHETKERAFGCAIKAHRIAAGKTVKEVARGARISDNYLAKLEEGRAIPPPRMTCEKIVYSLNIQPNKEVALLELASIARGSADTEELLNQDVQGLLDEIRRNAHLMPQQFVRHLTVLVRSVAS